MGFLADLIEQRFLAACLFSMMGMVAAYLLVRVVTWVASRTSPSSPTPPLPDDPHAIKVMVLGLEGSGKTMMLAGMYYRWAFGGRHGVVLRADEATAEFLRRIMKIINDPDSGLPPATREGDVTKATFTFIVNIAGNGPSPSFSLHYIDYDGERIRQLLFPSGNQTDPQVAKDLAAAHVLVGVLDGGQIARAMRGDPPLDFANTVTGLILHLANAKQKTIHLVISKWDLVVDENGDRYPLPKVIEFLDTYPPFLRFHQQSPATGVRRIIPVSTVGLNGFIEVDVNGTVRKDNAVPWRPFMAENAVACSVPDVIDTEFERAIKMYHAAEQDGRRRPRGSLAPLVKVVPWLFATITTTFGLPSIFDTRKITSDDLIDFFWALKDRTGTRPTSAENKEPPEHEGVLRVLRLFAESVRELENEFPDSQIGRYRPPRRRPRGNAHSPDGPRRR